MTAVNVRISCGAGQVNVLLNRYRYALYPNGQRFNGFTPTGFDFQVNFNFRRKQN